MEITKFKPSPLRLTLAGFTAAAGGIVSIAMVAWGGPMARYLPTGEGFHIAAIIGAGLAGLLCAGGFGRGGRKGWLIAALVSCIATLLGASLGATLMSGYFGSFWGASLGLLAIIDASTSVAALATWGVVMAAVHLAARKVRTTDFAASP